MSEKTYTDGTVVNGPGQLPTRSPRQQDAEVLLRLLNDVESMLGGTNGLTIQLRAAIAAAPAQERIDALELEVRQLTEQIAELRHAPTPQADSQPAPLREGEWINDAGRIKWLMWRVQDLEAKLAARAPAASVQEDAARYRWIRGPVEESTRYSRWRIEYWDGKNGWQPMQREIMDSAIDTARKQGGA